MAFSHKAEVLHVKEEPEEKSIKQEEEQLQVPVSESNDVCVKTEESSQFQQTELKVEDSETDGDTEHSSDYDEDWRAPLKCSAAKKSLYSRNKSSHTVNNEDMSETAEGAEKNKHQCTVNDSAPGSDSKWDMDQEEMD
ncbi:hypothetical protein WMY93_022539 [Mugilogobius chulae]|uniref:Uncharacterized protein n=1 Tax=Mugilogobius chulae TaxID=88201 RepID=A0AAW0NIF1_9GOBI